MSLTVCESGSTTLAVFIIKSLFSRGVQAHVEASVHKENGVSGSESSSSGRGTVSSGRGTAHTGDLGHASSAPPVSLPSVASTKVSSSATFLFPVPIPIRIRFHFGSRGFDDQKMKKIYS
jgi:hypothetical protein